jgi:hypothetical protein
MRRRRRNSVKQCVDASAANNKLLVELSNNTKHKVIRDQGKDRHSLVQEDPEHLFLLLIQTGSTFGQSSERTTQILLFVTTCFLVL